MEFVLSGMYFENGKFAQCSLPIITNEMSCKEIYKNNIDKLKEKAKKEQLDNIIFVVLYRIKLIDARLNTKDAEIILLATFYKEGREKEVKFL